MQGKNCENNILKYLFYIFMVSVPLISAELFCIKDGMAIQDVYIPLGGWSDEVTYYKQIEGILSHGMPRGFFGYNQSKAMLGSLSVWGIFPLIPYVIWGFLFGWNYVSPIYANIFLSMLALLCVCLLLRPSWNHIAVISLFWIANPFLNRYVLSGVVEAYVVSQLLIVTASGIYLLSDHFRENQQRCFNRKKDSFILGICTVTVCIMSLARPYYAVLFLIPFWKAFKDKRKALLIALPMLAIGCMVLFFLNNYYFCSKYFSNVLSFEKIKSGGGTRFSQTAF